MKKTTPLPEHIILSPEGEHMTHNIEESWIVNAKLRESHDLAYQKWFNKVGTLKETVQNGFIDFSHKIFTEDLYKYIGDPRQKTSLEIGFGGGRLINAASKYFNMCYGLDILDPSSIEKTQDFLKKQGCSNHTLLHRDNSDVIEDGSIDFIYSFIVFQHFKDWDEVLKYFSLFKRVMAPGAIAKIYFKALPPRVFPTPTELAHHGFPHDKDGIEEWWFTKMSCPSGDVLYYRESGGAPPAIKLSLKPPTEECPIGIGSFSSLYLNDKFVLQNLEANFKILEQPTYQTKTPWSSNLSNQFHITFMKRDEG